MQILENTNFIESVQIERCHFTSVACRKFGESLVRALLNELNSFTSKNESFLQLESPQPISASMLSEVLECVHI